ncbi:AraC family transcriptional regulator [Stenotrophomonas sp. 24(2023)]|uniref:AraC family transcriptional regulator n=1 Tax=Stenotrophomonas sp. 24(2023) TaxID=3068324 RepID=UPI0027DFDE95|nr:AraC family transcriptional regulator [Stenotrophomonas sp. 24(2023)]WMJ70620.1 AraC family transcriptional regulator [Stenotrophomonas sp. 24(2023)]
MTDTLRDAAYRHAAALANPAGVARTSIPGLSLIQAAAPSGIDYAISRPLLCLVLQGAKRVTQGAATFDFAEGDALLITADVPTVSQVTRASAMAPYLSLVLDLDLPAIAGLALEMKLGPAARGAPIRVERADADVTGAAQHLLQLLDHPAALPVLVQQRLRELHYWLLVGQHGLAVRQLGWPGAHAQRVARAVALLRSDFARPLPVERLAAVAGMSPSAFHQHFRAATSLSPLQFQKQLRLIEARRLLLAEGLSASSAAFAVGYESVQQFTREYRRMFGLPPGRDAGGARMQAPAPH